MNPWDYPVPKRLYKYLPPDRIDVLTRCHIRFSQRQVFEDCEEFKVQVESLGSDEEVTNYIQQHSVFADYPSGFEELAVEIIKKVPGAKEKVLNTALASLRTPDLIVALCLTENPESSEMWKKYSRSSQGFVICFDTRHPGFRLLWNPGRFGRVEYSDDPIESFLAEYMGNVFFRKRTAYSYEAEWRSIRTMRRFKRVVQRDGEMPIYLSPFDPLSVSEILIKRNCVIEWELRHFVAIDSRYSHVKVCQID